MFATAPDILRSRLGTKRMPPSGEMPAPFPGTATGALLTFLLLCAGMAGAATRTWSGGGADNNWSTPGNWGGTAPSAGDDLVFAGVTRLAPVNDFAANTGFNSISFAGGAGAFTIAGNAVMLSGGPVAIASNVSSGMESLNLQITFTAAPTITVNAGGALTLGGLLSMGSYSLTANVSGNAHLSGAIGGSGGLTKTGNGALTLSGSNSYSGPTTVATGMLVLDNPSALGSTGSGTSVYAGAGLDLNGINYASPEPLTLNGLGPGSLGALTNSSAASATFAGLLTLGSATGIVGGSGSINLTHTGSITGAYDLTLGGNAGGSIASVLNLSTASVTKEDQGVWLLSGTNLYSGTTSINAGILAVAGANALGTAAGGTLVVPGAALDLNGTAYTMSEPLTLNGAGPSGIGALINSGAGPAVFAGALTLGSAASVIGQSGTIALTYSGSVSGAGYPLTLGGAAGGTLAGTWNGTGSLTKTNSGTWTLLGANTSTAATVVDAGILKLGAADVIHDGSPVTVNGTLDMNGFSETIGSLSGSGTVNNSSGSGSLTLTCGGDNSNTAFTGSIHNASGTLNLIKMGTGTVTLSGANTYSGTTTIAAGAMNLGAAGVIPDNGAVIVNGTLDLNGFSETIGSLEGTGYVDNTSGAGTYTLTTGGSNVQTFWSGVIRNTTGSVALTKLGTAYFLLTGANSHSGVTTVNGGVLSIGNNGTTGEVPGNMVVASGAAIRFARSDGQTYAGSISGSGQVMKINAGTLTITGTNTYTGATMITGGTFAIGNGGTTGSIQGTILIAGGGAGSVVFNRSDNVTYADAISGADATGSVVKNGPNILTLSGANDYTGSTLVHSGTLKLGAAGSIPDASALTVNGILDLNGFNETVGSLSGTGTVDNTAGAGTFTLTAGGDNANSVFTGILQNSSQSLALDKIGSGTLTLSGANAHSGATTVSAGVLKLGAAGTIPDGGAVIVNGILDLNGFDETIGSLAGTGTVDNGSGSGTYTLTTGGSNATTVFSGNIQNAYATVAITKSGTGTMTLSGANSYAGVTTIGAGTLRLASASALGTIAAGSVVNTGAALDLNGVNYAAAEALTLNGTGIASSGALINGNSAGAVFAGALALAGPSSIIGGTGTITLSNNAYPGSAAVTLGGAQGGSFSPTLAAGALTKQDAGTWTIHSGFNLSGLTLSGGTLNLGTGHTHVLSTTLSITGGTLDFGSSTLQVAAASADFSALGALTPGTGMLEFTGVSAQTFTPKASAAHPALTITASGGVALAGGLNGGPVYIVSGALDLGTGFTHTLTGDFMGYAGGLDFGSSILSVQGNVGLSGLSTLVPGSGTLRFSGTGAQSFTPKSGGVHPAITHTGTGSVALASYPLECASFSQSTGSFGFTGLNLTTTGNFSVTNGGASSLTGLGGITITVGGTTSLSGVSAAAKLLLNPGTAWTLASTGAITGSFLDLGWSYASVAAGACSDCVNAGSNANWDFATVWDGGGADGNWSTAGNWGGDAVPGPNDHVIFNATNSKSADLDVSATVKGISFNSGYAGAFGFGSNALTVSGGDADFRSGGGISGSSGFLIMNSATAQNLFPKPGGALIGSFSKTGAGTCTVNGAYLNAGTLSVTGGTLDLGSGFDHQAGAVSGSGSLDFNSSNLDATGDVDLSGLAAVTATAANALRFTGSSAQTYKANASNVTLALVQNGTGGTTASAPSFTASSLAIAGGAFNLGSGLIHTIVNGLNLTGGILDFGSSTLQVQAASVNLASLAGLTAGSGTLRFTGASAQTFTPMAGATHPNLNQYGSGGTTIAGNGVTAATLTLNSGTFNLGAGLSHYFTTVSDGGGGPYGSLNFGSSTLHVTGNVSLGNVPALTPGTGGLAFDGPSGIQIFVPKSGGAIHPSITHAGAGTVQIHGDGLFCLGFAQSAGTLDWNGRNITTTSGGHFSLTNGSPSSFAGLSGRTLTVDGNAAFAGLSSASKANLDAAAAWYLVVAGALTAEHVSLGNNSATVAGGSGAGVCNDCADLSGNSGWNQTVTWDGEAGADHNWTTALNWGSDAVPTSSDAVVFNSSSSSDCILDASSAVKSIALEAGYTGTFDFASHTLTVNGDADFRGGGAIIAGTGTLSLAGSAAQTLYPKSGATLPNLIQNGSGGTTLSGFALDAGDLTLATGTFHLGASASNHSVRDISGSGGLDFGGAALQAKGDVDLSGATLTTVSASSLAFTGTSAQTFSPNLSESVLKLTQNGAGGTTVIAGSFTTPILFLQSGTLNLGSGLSHQVGNSVSATGGGLHFGTASDLAFSGPDLDLSGLASLTAGTGSLTFTGASAQGFTPFAGASHPTLVRSGSGGTTTSTAGFSAAGLSILAGTFDLGAGLVHSVGWVSGSGTLVFGSSTLEVTSGDADLDAMAGVVPGTGALAFTGTGAQTLTPWSGALPAVIQSGSGTTTVAGYDLTSAALTVADGAFDIGVRILNVTGNISITSGSLSAQAGTIHLAGDLTATGGGFQMPAAGKYFGVGGNIAITSAPTLFHNSGTITLDGTAAGRTLDIDNAVYGLTVNGPGGGWTVANHGLLGDGALNLIDGSLNLGVSLLNRMGSFASSTAGASLDFGSGTLRILNTKADFAGLADLIPGSGTLDFAAATGTQTLTAMNGTATHPMVTHSGAGTLQLGAYPLVCKGFSQTAGILDFNGRDLTVNNSGDFSISNGTPYSIANLGGATLTVAGAATFAGASSASRLNLDPGSAWTLNAVGAVTGTFLTLANANASSHSGSCADCADGGGNVNWTFADNVIPENVSAFLATALDGHSAALAWTASTSADADSVMLRYRTDGVPPQHPGDGIHWRNVAATVTEDTASGLADKTVFHFAAFARDSSGNFALKTDGSSDSAGTPDVTAPAGVEAFLATATGATSVSLAWNASPSADVENIVIRYRADGAYPADASDGILWQALAATVPGETVTGLVPNTVYHFAAFTRDSSGNFSTGSAQTRDTALYQLPVSGTLSLAEGQGRLKTPMAAIAFTWSDADSLRFSLPEDTASAAWTGLRASDSISLASGPDGLRSVFAQFKNAYGLRSPWYRDSAVLDRAAPVVTLAADSVHGWRTWPDALAGKALDAILGTDSVFVIRRRVGDGAYFNGAGWSGAADTAKLRADSVFSVPMPNAAMTTGAYDFTAYARDRIGNVSEPLTVRVNYTQNRPPALAASTGADTLAQNQQAEWTIDVGDPDAGDSLGTLSADIPAWLALTEKPDTARGGFAVHRIYTLAGKPGQDDVGNAIVTIQAVDLAGRIFNHTRTIKVMDVNDPPSFALERDSADAVEDGISFYRPRFADPDPGDTHTLALLQAPAWAAIKDSALVLKPGSRDAGVTAIRLTVSDGKSTDTLELKVAVANVNDAPIAFPSSNWRAEPVWKEDVADSFTVVVVDMDKGDPVSLATVLPAWIKYQASVDPVEGYNRFFRFLVNPKQADTGALDLKLRFQDASGAASELPFSARVMAVNDTPIAVIEDRQTRAGAARVVLNASDPDGNAASTRFHYRLISATGDTIRRGICASAVLSLHPLADGAYRLAVRAEDEGGLKQPGFTFADLAIAGATNVALDSGRWNMIGYPGRSLSAGALGPGHALTTWNESSSDGSPLGRYAAGPASDSLARGKGYWVRVSKPVNLAAPVAELLEKSFALKLTHGRQGWNQIGNPFPYYVDLSAAGLQFWEWDAVRRDLVNAKGILKPWGAYWVQVSRDTTLTLRDEPYFPPSETAAGALAKSAGPASPSLRASDWTLQMSLQAGPYHDEANFLGIRNVTRASGTTAPSADPAAGESRVPDAPKFGDFIALHFERPGAAAAGAQGAGTETGPHSAYLGYAEDFRAGLGEDEEWWDFNLENSGSGFDAASLSLPGLENLRSAGLHAFLVRRGQVAPLVAGEPARLAMEGRFTPYAIVVTPHADFAERLRGNFSISQNFPNPVRTHTIFRFALPQTWDAAGRREAKAYRLRLNVYDYSGRLAARVAEGTFKPGSHSLIWKPLAANGGPLAKGAYIYRLEVPGFTKSLKLLLK